MASTTGYAGSPAVSEHGSASMKAEVYAAICRLSDWLERNNYEGYDTFDGLSSKLLRPLTFNSSLLRTVLLQGVRRFPINTRPLIGIAKSRSTKGMGFLARGFMRLEAATGDSVWRGKAVDALQWLIENQSPGYSGACWGNHFDYQSRTFYLPKGVPTIVWTALIGHSFVDACEQFGSDRYLRVAVSACEHIVKDLATSVDGDGSCISYIPSQNKQVHNANMLGASLLARVYAKTQTEDYRALAEKAIRYTAQHQRADGSWYYGEAANLHWIDNFHTAYVLDSFKHYIDSTGDGRYEDAILKGYAFWKGTFFLPDGTPKYYHHKCLPVDIQCCAQAIDTLVFFNDRDSESLNLALRVARWTIDHMQDTTGYFYYRRYSRSVVNKTPTLHWGQATMLCALANLYKSV